MSTAHADGEYGEAPAGFRLPPGTRPGTVRLQVSELAASLRFYRELLGFAVLRSEESRLELGPGAGGVLLELRERPGARPSLARGRLGLYHFAILLPDRAGLGRFTRRLLDAGVRPAAADHLVSEALYLRDPDGLGVEVYADRPRSAWQRRGRELAMTTDPLDLERLARAGGPEPWGGIPDGTTIGHLHLHVGDLEEASDFYHEALGLDRVVWSYPGALFLAAGGYHHHLGLNTWAGPGARPPPSEEARLLEWELLVPAGGAVAAARSLEAAGHAVEPEAAGWRTRDPWGTALRLVERAEASSGS